MDIYKAHAVEAAQILALKAYTMEMAVFIGLQGCRQSGFPATKTCLYRMAHRTRRRMRAHLDASVDFPGVTQFWIGEGT